MRTFPQRRSHLVAELYGHDDETLVAWQRFCAQAAEALRPQHESERLAKALTLAQNGDVVLEDDGTATVQGSCPAPYTVSGALCDCPDATKRGAPCKHVLAVAIHQQALALLAPSTSAAPQPAATTPPPTAPAQKTRQGRPPSADRWDVHEAPASCCLRLRVGELELLYTMRDTTDAELTSRVQHLVPWVQDLLDQARERQASWQPCASSARLPQRRPLPHCRRRHLPCRLPAYPPTCRPSSTRPCSRPWPRQPTARRPARPRQRHPAPPSARTRQRPATRSPGCARSTRSR